MMMILAQLLSQAPCSGLQCPSRRGHITDAAARYGEVDIAGQRVRVHPAEDRGITMGCVVKEPTGRLGIASNPLCVAEVHRSCEGSRVISAKICPSAPAIGLLGQGERFRDSACRAQSRRQVNGLLKHPRVAIGQNMAPYELAESFMGLL